MKIKFAFLGILTALSLFAAEYKLSPASGIKIDGKLDEQSWQAANTISNFVLLKNSGKTTPSEKTEVKMLTDQDALYFGFKCYGLEDLSDDLKGEVTNAWANDLVEIFIAPTAGKDEYYQFALTAGGAYWSQFFAEAGNIKPDPYKPGFQLATGRTSDAWILEVRFPYSAFYMTSAAKTARNWAINVARYSRPKKSHATTENSSWANLQGSFHETKKFNMVTGIPPKPAKFDMLIPTVTFGTQGRNDKGFNGILDVEISLASAPAGKYTLETMGQKISANLKKGSNNVTLPATFEKDGRTPIALTVKNAAGEVVCDRKYPVLVDATAYALNFTSPQYGGHFYPGEDTSWLAGNVKVNTAEKEVTLTVAGKAYKLPVKNGLASFKVNVAKEKGDIPLSVGDINTVVKHVNDARAWIRDGKIIVAGKAQYQLGWYGGPGWITSKAVLEKFPTTASKHPITLIPWTTLDPGRLLTFNIEKEEVVFDRKPSQKVLDATKKAIEKNRLNPAYSYYLSDEPECRGLSPIYLRHLYRYIKELDPTRLVVIISRDPVRYIDCCDIINPHPYLSPSVMPSGERLYGCTPQRLRDMCASVEKLNRPDKALMLTPQVHSYSFNNVFADYPTFDETNVSVWSSVVHGGQGITPYIWYDHFSRPGVNLGCDFIYNSLYYLNDYITAPEQKRLPGDEGRMFVNGKKTMYVICNVYNEPKEYAFETKCRQLFRFRSNEVFKPSKGKVTLSLKPYEVYVLTSEKEESKLPSEADVRAAIDKAEYERTHRGNILFGKARTIEVDFPPSKPYTRIRPLEQQDKMFDGNIMVDAWEPHNIDFKAAWYEMSFTDEVPQFSKARIYGHDIQDLTLKIWKFGKWVVPEAKRTSTGKYDLELDFGKTLRTVKIRLEFTKKDIELYEFELLK